VVSATRIGGIHVTDVSNAARTFLMDIRTLSWDAGLLQRFGLSEGMLPRICSNAEVYGTVKHGLLAGVPIAGGQQ
jgi:glycerol kinase